MEPNDDMRILVFQKFKIFEDILLFIIKVSVTLQLNSILLYGFVYLYILSLKIIDI